MKGSSNQNQPNNKMWNILATFLLICALDGLHIVLTAKQDVFHYIFNIIAVVSVLISSIGVFAYSNNRAIFTQGFWVNYFYAYVLFTVFYNFHCSQHHSLQGFSESVINSFKNIGVITLLTLYVLYRYALVKNSF